MRCLTLADALRKHGAQTRFISRYLPKHLRNKLLVNGHEFALLESAQNDLALDELTHATWLGVGQPQDAADSVQRLSDKTWDWLIVDHYALDFRWESTLRQKANRILAIDDIADRHHDCDILLDQNFYLDMEMRYVGKVPAHCQLKLGPRYALLRDEFRKLHERIKPHRGSVNRILVFFGGVDAENYTGRAIEALSIIDTPDLEVDVVIGAQHPCREQIEAACAQQHFVCHVQTSRMAELMETADLAIGAAGSASWERCCLALPCVVGAVALNQVQAAKDLSQYGAVRYVGTRQEITVERLRTEIERACSRDWLISAAALGVKLVDAQGAERIIECMEAI